MQPLFNFFSLIRVIKIFIVYLSDQPILHKTFHRYVVRAKRGTVQSQHDSAGRNARSAGANIRRHQEQAFKDVINKKTNKIFSLDNKSKFN